MSMDPGFEDKKVIRVRKVGGRGRVPVPYSPGNKSTVGDQIIILK